MTAPRATGPALLIQGGTASGDINRAVMAAVSLSGE
jgi:hypothetical protein